MKHRKLTPDEKRLVARIARKLWSCEADRREGRETVEAVLRLAVAIGGAK